MTIDVLRQFSTRLGDGRVYILRFHYKRLEIRRELKTVIQTNHQGDREQSRFCVVPPAAQRHARFQLQDGDCGGFRATKKFMPDAAESSMDTGRARKCNMYGISHVVHSKHDLITLALLVTLPVCAPSPARFILTTSTTV